MDLPSCFDYKSVPFCCGFAAVMQLLSAAILCLCIGTATCVEVLQSASEHSSEQVARGRPHLPWAGNGTCEPVHHEESSGVTSVHCLGPKHLLKPGQTIDVMMLLANPYPENETVVVLNQTAQLVDDSLRPVPLSEVYVHHYVTSYLFLLGNGAELRGSYTRRPLPEPYGLVVNGSFVGDERQRLTNIQLINTAGLPPQQAKPCLECWCDHDPFHPASALSAINHTSGHPGSATDRGDPTYADASPKSKLGSLVCCHQCPSTTPDAPEVGYHLQYNVTYRVLKHDDFVNRTDLIGFDVVGGRFEYNIPEALGPNSTHVKSFDTIYDEKCPQKQPVDIIRCNGHQHFGGQCVELINLDKNETICRSCPRFGTEEDVPGDEDGYVVKIVDDDMLNGPYTIAPGTRVRIQSKYDASVPRFGVMGLITTWAAGLPEPCYDPPVNTSNSFSVVDVNTPLYNHMGFPLEDSISSVLTA